MHGVVTTSLLPVRAEPKEQSELVDQYLFGEPYRVLGEKGGWTRVESLIGGHPGWVDSKLVVPLDHHIGEYLDDARFSASLIQTAGLPTGEIWLPAGSLIPFYDNQMFYLNGKQYRFLGNFFDKGDISTAVYELLNQFVGSVYLWGGKTFMGIDCSGLTQVVYRTIGIILPRNSSQQAIVGRKVPLEESQVGDLAFFAKEPDIERITHVGIILRKGRIIHASGTVHLSGLDNTGIFELNNPGQYTHYLKFVKRIIEI